MLRKLLSLVFVLLVGTQSMMGCGDQKAGHDVESYPAIMSHSDRLMAPVLPTETIIGDRTYVILSLFKKGEEDVSDQTMLDRSKNTNASSTEEHGHFILKNQGDIPVSFRGRVIFNFLDWRNQDGGAAYICWDGGKWYQSWAFRGDRWNNEDNRVVRFVPNAPDKK